MTHAPRFSILLLPNTWPAFLAQTLHVEALGFDLVSTGDHFVDWNDPSRDWLEAWSLLAGIAQATSRIRLATYVSQFPLRNPAMLARQALTVDHISGGRLEVGLGTGLTIDPAYGMIGIPNFAARERVARFKEYAEIVEKLLAHETASYSGEYYQVTDAVMNPRPVQSPRPPIVIAALGPVMMRFAARLADNWNTLSFKDNIGAQLAESKDRMALVQDECARIGRDPANLRCSYTMFDPASRASGGGISYYDSVGAFQDQAGAAMELGFSELCLYYPILKEQMPMFERISQDVLPKLRG